MKNKIKSNIENNRVKIGVFLILLVGTIATIYISPNNWLTPTLFFILSLGGLLDTINKRKFKILIIIIVLILIVISNKLDLLDAIFLFL
tara:strand:- start:2574 stop:2840 length:267 start_codon:yes stop_codon:yes gene_type:complete